MPPLHFAKTHSPPSPWQGLPLTRSTSSTGAVLQLPAWHQQYKALWTEAMLYVCHWRWAMPMWYAHCQQLAVTAMRTYLHLYTQHSGQTLSSLLGMACTATQRSAGMRRQ